MDFEPPFQGACKSLLQKSPIIDKFPEVEECELPVIDLIHLDSANRVKCMNEIAEAASQWGFFQVVNHGISPEVLNSIQDEQNRVFHQPFDKKIEKGFLNLSPISYRWGNPKATGLRQFSWSEALHISMEDVPSMKEQHRSLRLTIEAFVKDVSHLAESLAEILAQPLGTGVESSYFKDHCPPRTCFLRLNRYAPCPFSSQVFGFCPHTDSDFLTIVHQDQVGGLELFKDGRWIGVKPNSEALVVNIGDLFEALSNGVYKSIKHRVITNQKVERFSLAYFYCPSMDAVIQSRSTTEPAVFKSFTFREYKRQTERDVQELGEKIGLSRFLL